MQYIYENSPDNRYRYVLGTEGQNPLIVMSINPSVGAPDVDSPTLGTVRKIADYYGYDSWIILCLYPQRATHLGELAEMADPAQVKKNNAVIRSILSRWPHRKIWAAWGTHYQDRFFFPQCLADIVAIADEFQESWMYYGPLDAGDTPHYCLYIDPGEGFHPFDVKAYLERSAY